MQISAANPQRAKVFLNGKWSGWMDRDEAQTLEDAALWGRGRKDGIYPLAVAQRLQITPASVVDPEGTQYLLKLLTEAVESIKDLISD